MDAWARGGGLVFGAWLVGCRLGGSSDSDGQSARPEVSDTLGARRVAAPSEPELELRRAMFERLIADISASHVFSSVWTEPEWSAELPVLRAEVMQGDRARLLAALRHVSNSLRDGHLAFTPSVPEVAREVYRLSFELGNAGSLAQPRLVVTRAARGSGIAPGDVLLAYDGVPSEQLLERYRFELNASSPGARVAQLMSFLQSPRIGAAAEEAVVPLTLRHGAGVVHAEASFLPPAPPVTREHSAAGCPAPSRRYGGSYELVESGSAVCLYRASREPFASHPIVRHISFRYTPEARQSDHERVKNFLATTPHVAGVLLDLRDNGGGTAADYILPWYAPGPHRPLSEWVRLDPQLTDRARLRRALRAEAAVDEYLRRVASGEGWWVRPFDCGGGGCDGSQARALGRVTNAPVALLLGPGCRSACDSFAAIWSREHFGPSVGTPPAAMYTSLRYPLAVELGSERLGEFSIALCGLRFDAGEPWLEGRPLPVDVAVEPNGPRSSDESPWLEAAIAALRPWHSPPVGSAPRRER